MDIKGRLALVTGAASGLGLASARLLAARGARVAFLDMDAKAGQRAADETGGGSMFRALDVRDGAAVESVLAAIADEAGPPLLCLNCAGIAPASRVLGRDGAPLPLADFQRVIDINLVGSFNVLRVAAAQMAAADADADGMRGLIINTASVAAWEGQVGQAAYSASKGGVAGMTLPLARDLARLGIRVCAIAPGIMATPMLMAMPQKVQDSLAASIPCPSRMGRPDEYASLVLHLVDNDYINGTVIRLDGAIRMAAR